MKDKEQSAAHGFVYSVLYSYCQLISFYLKVKYLSESLTQEGTSPPNKGLLTKSSPLWFL